MSKYKARIEKDRVESHRAILRYIKRRMLVSGESPLIREISEHMEVTNNTINNRIKQLIDLGFLEKCKSKRRGLSLTMEGRLFYAS